MDLEEVKACLRGLLSSTALSYNLNGLLNDFRNMTGSDLPLFGYLHPIEFLRTLSDTVQLIGKSCNPEVALVNSKKSAHITSLVDRQKTKPVKSSRFLPRHARLIVPASDFNEEENRTEPSQLRIETRMSEAASCSKVTTHTPKQSHPKTVFTAQPYFFANIPDQMPKPVLRSAPLPLCDGKTNSVPTGKEQDEKSVEVSKNSGSGVEGKFPDVSDSESCLSLEDFRSNNMTSNSCFINDGIKNKLRRLIRDAPEGLWCCNLPWLFEKEYKFALDYREFGYTSLIQMLSELPDVFRCVRPGNDDWLLFDASVAPSPEERKMMDLQATADINCEIAANLRKLLFNFFENTSESLIDLDRISELYKKIYGSCLDFHSLGFRDLKSFLKTWEGSLFKMVDCDGKTFLVPTLKNTVQSSIPWSEAVPPITAENDIFIEIFPKDVVGPEESLLELDLARHVAVGSVIKVTVAEVWSPSLFYLQLNRFRSRLNVFMDELQKFYNLYLNKYKMPDSTIRPKQICVGLYTSDPEIPDEWHRAEVVKVINEKTVLVNFVDYGTETRVKKTHLRFLHRSFQSFPVQGLLAQLSGVMPASCEGRWPVSTSKRFLELVRVPTLDAEIVDIDFKKPRMSVILSDPSHKSGANINKKLVLEKLACWKDSISGEPVKEEPETAGTEQPKPAERQTSQGMIGPTDGSVQEQFNSNLPEITDEFSDIADIGQPTLFQFRMKCLKLDDSSTPIKSRNEQINLIENLNYEFDEVPDLDVKVETEKEDEPSEERKPSTSASAQPSPTAQPSPPLQPPTATATAAAAAALPGEKLPNLGPPAVPQEQLPLPPRFSIPDECNSVPFAGKPKRLPPGLEHANPLSIDLNQIGLASLPDDLKKCVNVLAMQLLTTNASIKQVGLTDPVLAVKIATDMAEACITSKCSHLGFNPLLTSFFQLQTELWNANSSSEPIPKVANPSPLLSSQPQPKPSPRKSGKEQNHVTEIQTDGKTLHLVTIDQGLYFCAEQIVRSFTPLSGREVADRILQVKKIPTDYRIITKATDEKVLNAIKSSQLPIVKKKSKKSKIYLIPVGRVVPVLQSLGCSTKNLESYFQELESMERKQKTPEKKENSEVS